MKLTLLITLAVLGILLGAGFWLYTPDRPRAALEAKYLRGPADLVEVAGLRLHVRDDGPRTAPAIILIHGFASSLHTWEPWAEALTPDYRVVRFDLPGFGLTGPDPTGDYGDERALEVLLALMDRLDIPRAAIVGHSLGGRLAWLFAATYPARVEKLVLIAPDGFASPGLEYGKAPEVPALAGLMRHVMPSFLVRMSLKPAYADPGRITDDLVARYRDMMLAPGVRGAIIERMGQVVLTPPEPMLARIEVPTLLLWGTEDGMIPVANAADYQAALPDSRLVTLPGLGHVPHEEDPARSLAPVRAFLTE